MSFLFQNLHIVNGFDPQIGYDKIIHYKGELPLFGYIKAHKAEMRMKDYEAYRAVYCTLCRELGHSFGPFARFTLNYDFTFLAVLMLAMSKECPGLERRRCVFNPLVRCAGCAGARKEITYSASVAMCMLYYKLRDDMEDRGFWRRIPSALVYPLFALARKKAAVLAPQADRIMAEMMERQRSVESGESYSVDAAAEPTAWALSQIFSQIPLAENAASDPQRRVLERLGYCLGRWVYLVDAMNDMEDDLRHGEYNPYLHRFNIVQENAEAIRKAQREILPGLNVCISEACAAFELLEIHHFREIIHNILYYGLEQVQNSVADGSFRQSDRRQKK